MCCQIQHGHASFLSNTKYFKADKHEFDDTCGYKLFLKDLYFQNCKTFITLATGRQNLCLCNEVVGTYLTEMKIYQKCSSKILSHFLREKNNFGWVELG